jgi:hypothetical protein
VRENEIYFPNTRAYEDILYSRLVAFYSKKCLFINKVFYHALMRSGSTTRNMGFNKIYDALEIIKISEKKFLDKATAKFHPSLYKEILKYKLFEGFKGFGINLNDDD